MRALLIIACFVSTSAEQHGFSSALTMIQNQMSSLKLDGDSRSAGLAQGRALIINSMLSEFEGTTEMSDEVRTELNKIPPIINSIIDDLKTDKGTHDTSISAVASMFSGCVVSATKLADESAKNQSDKDDKNHSDCRSNLFSSWIAMAGTNMPQQANTACHAFWDFVEENPDNKNSGNNGDANEMCEWKNEMDAGTDDPSQEKGVTVAEKLFRQRDNWYSQDGLTEKFMEEYERLRDDCKTKFQTLSDQTSDCNKEQTDYRGSYCTWAQRRLSRCNEEDECYDKAVEHRHKVISYVCPAQAQRKEDAAVLKYLICLVNWLVTQQNDPKELQKMLDSCANELCDAPSIATVTEGGVEYTNCSVISCPKYHDEFGNDMPAQPDQESCVVEDPDFVAMFGATNPTRTATHPGDLNVANVFTLQDYPYSNLQGDNLPLFGLAHHLEHWQYSWPISGLWKWQEWKVSTWNGWLYGDVSLRNGVSADGLSTFHSYFEVQWTANCPITDRRYVRTSHSRSPCSYYEGDAETTCNR